MPAIGTGTTFSDSGASLPLFLIVITGVIMSYAWANNLLYRMTGNPPPPPQAAQCAPERSQSWPAQRIGTRSAPL